MLKPYLKNKLQLYNQTYIYLFIVFLAGIVIYFPGLNGHFFILDDLYTIPRIPLLNSLDNLYIILEGNNTGQLKRPLSIVFLSVIKTLGGNNPVYFKYANFFLHSINTLLIFYFISSLSHLQSKISNHLPLLISIIWFLHPLQVSTVLYPVQFMAILSTTLILCSLNLYLHIRINHKENNIFLLFLLITLILASLLSKEIGALIPLHFLLLEWLFLSKYKPLNPYHRYKLTLIIIPLSIGGLITLYLFPGFINAYQSREFDLAERLLSESVIIGHYIRQILIPDIFEMSLFQDYWQFSKLDFFTIAFNQILLIIFIALGFYYRKKNVFLAYGIFLFFISHLLESTIIPLELAFEHRNYLASLGMIIAFTASITNIKKYSTFILIFIIALFSLLSLLRIDHWSNELKFYTVSAKKHPDSPRAIDGYAQILIHSGNINEGIKLYSQLKKTHNENGIYDIKLIKLICNTNKPLIKHLLNSDNIINNHYEKSINQVVLELFEAIYTKKCDLPIISVIAYHKELLLHPDIVNNKSYKKIIHLVLARYYWLNKQAEQSIHHYEILIRQNHIDAIFELLSIYQVQNDLPKIEATTQLLKKLFPDLSKKEQLHAKAYLN